MDGESRRLQDRIRLVREEYLHCRARAERELQAESAPALEAASKAAAAQQALQALEKKRAEVDNTKQRICELEAKVAQFRQDYRNADTAGEASRPPCSEKPAPCLPVAKAAVQAEAGGDDSIKKQRRSHRSPSAQRLAELERLRQLVKQLPTPGRAGAMVAYVAKQSSGVLVAARPSEAPSPQLPMLPLQPLAPSFRTATSASSTRSSSPHDLLFSDRSNDTERASRKDVHWAEVPAALPKAPPPKRRPGVLPPGGRLVAAVEVARPPEEPAAAAPPSPVGCPPSPGTPPGPPAPPPPKARPKTAKAPPPCKAKGKAKAEPKAPAEADGETPRGVSRAKLVNLHWRASLEPKEVELSASSDPYLCGVVEYLPKWGVNRFERCQSRLVRYERAAGLASGASVDEPLESVFHVPTPAHPSRKRCRRHTIFSGECAVEELSQHKLHEFFQARSAAFDISSRASCIGVSNLINDAKHRQILDILVRKEAILRYPKLTQDKGVDLAIGEVVEALRRCDYNRLSPGMLEDLRKVTSAYAEDKNKDTQTVVSFVKVHGEEALQHLEHPHLHRLLYGALQIPRISARLECMSLEATFADHVDLCRRNLQVLHNGFQCLLSQLAPLRNLFALAMQFGNTLNQDSNAQVSRYGFKLCSLPKLLELRLPGRKEVSLLHIMLICMRREEVDTLCRRETMEALQRAKAARTFTVYQDVLQQLEGFRRIQQLVRTGNYKGERIEDGDGSSDADGFFNARMKDFVESSQEKMNSLWKFSADMFTAYRDFSAFLDDAMIYPPPKDDQEEKKDLFVIFSQFFETINRVRAEVDEQDLASTVRDSLRIQVPYCKLEAAAPPKTDKVPTVGPVRQGGSNGINSHSGTVRLEQNEANQATPATNDVTGSMAVSSPQDSERPPMSPTKSQSALTSDLLSAQGVCSPRDLLSPTHKAVGSRPLSPRIFSPSRLRHQLDIEWPAPCKVSCAPSSPRSVAPAPVAPNRVVSEQDRSQSPENIERIAPILGPPPRRPTERPGAMLQPRSQCLSQFPAQSTMSGGGSFQFRGLPPLNLPLPSPQPLPGSAGGDVTPTGPRSPKRTDTPQTSPRTRFGWSSAHVHGMEGIYSTPARSTGSRTPTSPRTRLGRKSLTRIANRVASGFLKVNGPCNGSNEEVIEAGDADGSGDEPSSNGGHSPISPEGEQARFSSPGPDLQAQIWSEVRRRKSRARPGTPMAPPQLGADKGANGTWSSPCQGLWADLESLDSPVTPVKFYPLTPVKEQGETPYRLADWSNTPI
mmetsp:Transcript_69610/g.137772  ORF Transcript_69610/g.137772 Transcript_69610/m.137772 type:complete len:1274 (-) Transcript_69610:29-3850(-)